MMSITQLQMCTRLNSLLDSTPLPREHPCSRRQEEHSGSQGAIRNIAHTMGDSTPSQSLSLLHFLYSHRYVSPKPILNFQL